MADISNLVSDSSSQSTIVLINESFLSKSQMYRIGPSIRGMCSGVNMVWTNQYTSCATSEKVSSTRNFKSNLFLFITVAMQGCRHWSHNVRSGGQLGNDFCQVFLHTDITCLDWSVLSMVWGTSMRSSISSNDWG